ncbi:ABC-three component system middle component 8 [Bradyrhizobium oligotrophicum]|uniref:ABC-three component system middle component 8 n=1 Tax=Bradyrhizobium oligotrophicum TaxID=44255 RepID=UPI003EBCD24A
MLTPRKHLNLDVSVIRIASIMLRELQKRGVIEFERLRGIVIRRVGSDGDVTFLPALSFLYLLGKIEYHEKNDVVEYRAS